MITIGQPVKLTAKKGRHLVELERFEANPLHVLAGLAAPGSFFYKLTVNGQLMACRQDAAAVRLLCRSFGL